MLDVVNSYLEMWSKLLYVDQWYTIPVMTDEDARFLASLAPVTTTSI